MNSLKQNMLWLCLVLLLMFAVTGTSVIIGHAIFISYLKPDIDAFKERTIPQVLQEKPFRIQI